MFQTNLRFLSIILLLIVLMQCKHDESKFADTIMINGNVYTVDSITPVVEGIAIKNGYIISIGNNEEVLKHKGQHTIVHDIQGKFIMPGLIEGHGHFSGFGSSLINLNLLHTKSWEEIVDKVKNKAETTKSGVWIEGRGWHQEKWTIKPMENVNGYPYHNAISAVSPNNPVILKHASGHSLFANKVAMDLAGITKETADPVGGRIVRDHKGEAIGVFEENAMELINQVHSVYQLNLDSLEQAKKWFEEVNAAQKACLQNGITSFQDAGSKYYELERYRSLAESHQLDIRLWVMARHSFEEMKDKLKNYVVVGEGNNFYTCNAIKSEVDGALGSFGAWLIDPYSDKPGFNGQNTTPLDEVSNIASLAKKLNMQMCVHAIGDRANREVISIYEKQLADLKEDRRWRIEHAQHINPSDIPRMKNSNIIASMQGIHCTSDAPFVEKRLGHERSEHGAYAWRSFLDAGVAIANGTDVPVEDLDPMANLYALVTRKRADNGF